MNRDDILTIICKLKYSSNEFDDIQSAFIFEVAERRYEVSFKRLKGVFKSLHIEDTGPKNSVTKESEIK